MKQIKIAQAYNVTEGLSKDQNLSIDAKWVLYKLRKDLYSYYEFYLTESQNLFSEYDRLYIISIFIFYTFLNIQKIIYIYEK